MDPDRIIEALTMQPHPEGGHYAETYAERGDGGRGALTAIYFLLRAGERSHWHKVDAVEVWLWHAGAPLALEVRGGDAPRGHHRLGPAIDAGERPQAVVPKGAWQAARSLGAWTLVSCVVAPGFTFAGLELPDDPAFVP
ncbi:MAG: cupin domain-containing protein [Geminicoccaceae bacterium]|nr:cupin domain-containing protein [Geminicoccaceae bacterium]